MSQDIFIKIDGIDGESLDDKHSDEIDVLGWSWKITQNSAMHTGSGGGAGKAQVHDLEFEHYIDRASPILMQKCLTGKHLTNATLVVRKSGGEPLEYLRLSMEDVIVTKVEPRAFPDDDVRGREQIGLSFARVRQEYVVQQQTGGSGGTISAGYDLKSNKEL